MPSRTPAEMMRAGPAGDFPATRGSSSVSCGARRRAWQGAKVPALCLLALTAALLTGCGSASKPGTFSSQNYGYTAALPASWAGRQAQSQWNGASPGFEDSDVDVFTGPSGIVVIAFGAASPQSLAAYTKATLQAAAAAHGCPVVPASDQAITIGGAPARLLNAPCQGLSIETAISVHAGKAVVFVSQLASGTRADRAAFRRFLAGIRFQS
jgi:hypothetical protein